MAQPASPPDIERAKGLFRQGKTHYAAGDYSKAQTAFSQAAAIRPSPILDYNIGRCFHQLGKVDPAIAAYEKYLEQKKDAANAEKVKAWITELKQKKNEVKEDPYEALEETGGQGAAGPLTPAAAGAGAMGIASDDGAGGGTASQPTAGDGAIELPTGASTAASAGQPSSRAEAKTSGAAEPVHEATLPKSWSDRRATPGAHPSQPASPAPLPRPKEEGPLYKQWWFWTACIGGAVIAAFIISTAVDDNDRPASRTSGLRLQF